jgi:phage terminase small subunit
MTDDLVRQLRQASMTNEDYRWKAADMIERLRAALGDCIKLLDDLGWRPEAERALAALKEDHT